MNNYLITDLQSEFQELGINTELTETENKNQEFVSWQNAQDKKQEQQIVRNILSNVGIDPDKDLHEQLQNY